MFIWNELKKLKKEITDLNKKYTDLNKKYNDDIGANYSKISYLETKCKELIIEKENFEKKRDSEAYNSEVDVNFKSMKAFSIERIIKNNIGTTSIGYIRSTGENSEWHLQCNQENHNRLVSLFRKEILGN